MFLGNSHSAVAAVRAPVLGAMLVAASLVLPGTALSQPWMPNYMAVCTANNDQTNPAIASDGSGGSVIVWQDYRNGNYDIYAQRVNAGGTTLWTSNGVSVCTSGSIQQQPRIVGDGSGGAIIVWQDSRNGGLDIYAQRMNSSGSALWTSNGV
jgi:beta propeller repeat protein